MIEMTHPDLPGSAIEAVSEAQAELHEANGWVRATPAEADVPERVWEDTAAGLENEDLDELDPVVDNRSSDVDEALLVVPTNDGPPPVTDPADWQE